MVGQPWPPAPAPKPDRPAVVIAALVAVAVVLGAGLVVVAADHRPHHTTVQSGSPATTAATSPSTTPPSTSPPGASGLAALYSHPAHGPYVVDRNTAQQVAD